MNVVDLVVLAVLAVYALAGYRNGLISGALTFGGFLAGAIAGAKVEPLVRTRLDPSGSAHYTLALALIALGAVLGQFVGAWLAVRVRARLTWHPARTLDAVLGALLSAVGVLVVVWMLALPLASSPLVQLSRQVRESRIVRAVDVAMPDPVRSAYSSVRALAGANGFPEVFGSLQPTHIQDVAPPEPVQAESGPLARARSSVVKVLAGGNCANGSEGSGFVYAAGRVMTNAHVVAGMKTVSVEARGQTVAARVVLFDPVRDVAVLTVPATLAAPLRFAASSAAVSSSAVVAGYPQDGPLTLVAARVRAREKATGYTIYGSGDRGERVTREIYSIRVDVRPGNSGGPLLSPAGTVLGVVFARALDSADTGFALTAAEVGSDADAGRRVSVAVSTRSCVGD